MGNWMNTWGFRSPGKPSINGLQLRYYPFLRDSILSLMVIDAEVLAELRHRPKARLGFLSNFGVLARDGLRSGSFPIPI